MSGSIARLGNRRLDDAGEKFGRLAIVSSGMA